LISGFSASAEQGSSRSPGPAADEVVAKLAPAPACTDLASAASANHIPIERMDASVATNKLETGDSITGLVTLFEKKGRRQQWLLFLEAVAPQPKELPLKTNPPCVLYSGRGTKLEYTSAPAMVKLRTIGPFTEHDPKKKGPKAEDKAERFTLDEGSLSLGLDQAIAAVIRMSALTTNADIWLGSKPPDKAVVARSDKIAEGVKLTAAEERAIGGSIPALMSYFGMVQHVEALHDIMLKVVDLPSLWSMIWRRGVNANLLFETDHWRSAELPTWKLPADAHVYFAPMWLELNKHRSLDVTLVVTSPRPPLLPCGGVVGFIAQNPAEKEIYLTLQIVSARRGPKPG
jgi:hypothetical protein